MVLIWIETWMVIQVVIVVIQQHPIGVDSIVRLIPVLRKEERERRIFGVSSFQPSQKTRLVHYAPPHYMRVGTC